MQNNINNVSFHANLKPLTKINKKTEFIEAKKIFTEATKDYPDDNIYITRNTLGETVINLYNDTTNNFYTNKDICTKSIDKQIDELGKDKFAQKLINIFEALKLQQAITEKLSNIKKEVFRLTKTMEVNINAARNWESEGKNVIANRHKILSKNNEAKINQFKTEEKTLSDEYNKKIDELGKEFKEITRLKIR